MARVALEQAAASHARRSMAAALAAWWHWGACKATARAAAERAVTFHARRSQAAALAAWRRVADLRRVAGRVRQLYLTAAGFAAWRLQAQHASAKAAAWRLAVRACYMRQLWAGWAAWQQHHARQQRQHAARQHRQAALLRSCLAAWHGPFLAVARRRHAAEQQATCFSRRRRLQLAFSFWSGPFLAEVRRRRSAAQAAAAFVAARLRGRAWAAWRAWAAQTLDARLSAWCTAVAFSAQRRQRRALSQWRAGLRCVAAALDGASENARANTEATAVVLATLRQLMQSAASHTAEGGWQAACANRPMARPAPRRACSSS